MHLKNAQRKIHSIEKLLFKRNILFLDYTDLDCVCKL